MIKRKQIFATSFLFLCAVLIAGCTETTPVSNTVVNNTAEPVASSSEEKDISSSTEQITRWNNKPMLENIGKSENGMNRYISITYNFEVTLPIRFKEDINYSTKNNRAWFIDNSFPSTVLFNDLIIKVEKNDKNIEVVNSRGEFIDIFKEGKDDVVFSNFQKYEINNFKVFSIEEVAGIIDRWTTHYLITEDYLYQFMYATELGKSKEETYKNEKEESTISIIKTFKKLD